MAKKKSKKKVHEKHTAKLPPGLMSWEEHSEELERAREACLVTVAEELLKAVGYIDPRVTIRGHVQYGGLRFVADD